jgi:hypothetical protein
MIEDAQQDVFDLLTHAKSGLLALRKGVSRKGAKTVKEALELFDYFELLQDSVDRLWDDLADNAAFRVQNLSRFSEDKQACDLFAAVLAVNAVIDFLRFSPTRSLSIVDRHNRLKIFDELRQALLDLGEGGAPAQMLRPQPKNRGRRADVPSVLSLKGVLAGLMHCQQRAGMSRHQAAKWIADNMSPKLAERISRKPITARMVEEWLDRFGGKYAEQDAGRKAYLLWSQDFRPLTKQLFKTITERLATGDY